MANSLVAGFPGIIKDKVPESLAVSEEGWPDTSWNNDNFRGRFVGEISV